MRLDAFGRWITTVSVHARLEHPGIVATYDLACLLSAEAGVLERGPQLGRLTVIVEPTRSRRLPACICTDSDMINPDQIHHAADPGDECLEAVKGQLERPDSDKAPCSRN